MPVRLTGDAVLLADDGVARPRVGELGVLLGAAIMCFGIYYSVRRESRRTA